MQGMNFATAPTDQFDDSLIPVGVLAFAIAKLRPYNADQRIAETPSKNNPENAYLDYEFTIYGGRYNGRKVWHRIGVRGSENWINQGRAAIRAMLEVGRGANPHTNPNGYHIASYFDTDGLKIAIEIGQEKGDPGYRDKNTVKLFLSPNPDGPPHVRAKWDALLRGDTEPKPGAAKPAAAGAPAAAQGSLPLASQTPDWLTAEQPAAGGGAPANPQPPAQQQPSSPPQAGAGPAAPQGAVSTTTPQTPTISPSNQPQQRPSWL